MAIKSKQISLTQADGKKSISEILGVSEKWTHIFIGNDGGGSVVVGDASLTSSNAGLKIFASQTQSFPFDGKENVGDTFYLMVVAAGSMTVFVLAY